MSLLPRTECRRVTALWRPIRKWTVPEGDCIAVPTNDYYLTSPVWLSNEGTALSPKWVALDRYNDEDWPKHVYPKGECRYDLIGQGEKV